MAALTASEARLVARVNRSQRLASLLGALLTLAGVAYGVWAITRFDPRSDPRLDPGFDQPVARMAFAFDAPRDRLTDVRTETRTERMLARSIERGMNLATAVTLVLLRLFLATLVGLSGLVALTVVVERRRLLAIVRRLAEPDSLRANGSAATETPAG